MRIFIILLILCSSNLFGQNNEHPYYRIQSEFENLIKLSAKIDSIISASDKMEYRQRYIIRGISEGSIQVTDSLEIEIGSGGFSTYTFTNENTNKIIKAEHNQTVHYKYDVKDSLNVNSERLEIHIYYENEIAYFAIFNEYHFDNENIISSSRYYLQLNAVKDDIYFSNEFQKMTKDYIVKLSERIIAEK